MLAESRFALQSMHQNLHRSLAPNHAPCYAPTMSAPRVYTALDSLVTEALERAPRTGLAASEDSASKKLHALVEFANAVLRADEEREEKLAAYRELAADDDRARAIRASNLRAAELGIL